MVAGNGGVRDFFSNGLLGFGVELLGTSINPIDSGCDNCVGVTEGVKSYRVSVGDERKLPDRHFSLSLGVTVMVARNGGVCDFFMCFFLWRVGLLGFEHDSLRSLILLTRWASRAELKINFLRLSLNGDGNPPNMELLAVLCPDMLICREKK